MFVVGSLMVCFAFVCRRLAADKEDRGRERECKSAYQRALGKSNCRACVGKRASAPVLRGSGRLLVIVTQTDIEKREWKTVEGEH